MAQNIVNYLFGALISEEREERDSITTVFKIEDNLLLEMEYTITRSLFEQVYRQRQHGIQLRLIRTPGTNQKNF